MVSDILFGAACHFLSEHNLSHWHQLRLIFRVSELNDNTRASLLHHLEETFNCITNVHSSVCKASIQEVLENASCRRILKLLQTYLDSLGDGTSLSAFWVSYLDMTEIMLGLIRASREGNWLLHLAAIREMIPWCFAYDKVNYARYLTYYYASMSQLPTEHPDVHAHFMEGSYLSKSVARIHLDGYL